MFVVIFLFLVAVGGGVRRSIKKGIKSISASLIIALVDMKATF